MIVPVAPIRQPPRPGDLRTRRLVSLLMAAWRGGGPTPAPLRSRGATLDDVRAELLRREELGVGVAR